MKYINCKSILFLSFFITANASALSDGNKKELMVFSMKSLGFPFGVADIKKVPTREELNEVVATGINSNGHPCAQITNISPLKIKGGYEVVCIANRGGSASKAYILNSKTGVANEI